MLPVFDFASTRDGTGRRGGSGERLGLDRAPLQSKYESALEAQVEEKHREAVERLDALLGLLQQAAATTKLTRSDEMWLLRLRELCLRNLASSNRALGKHHEALTCLRELLRDSDVQRSDPDVYLWRDAANSAITVGDWLTARFCLECCLREWPGDTELMRSLARALLELGDNRACRRVLEAMSMKGVGLAQREMWLLENLADDESQNSDMGAHLNHAENFRPRRRKRKELIETNPISDADMLQTEYDNFVTRRAKRFRLAAPSAELNSIDAVRVSLNRLSITELFNAVESLSCRCMAPSKLVLFEWGDISSHEMHDHGSCHAGFACQDIADCLEKVRRSLDPLLSDKVGHSSRAAKELGILSVLRQYSSLPSSGQRSGTLGADAQDEIGDDTELAAQILRDNSPHSCSASCSPHKPWREWLFKIVSVVLDQLDTLLNRANSQHLLMQFVEFVVRCILLFRPGQRSNLVQQNWRGNWATPELLDWLRQPKLDCESVGSQRLMLRELLVNSSLKLAELCVALCPQATWIRTIGSQFLDIYRLLHADPFVELPVDSDRAIESQTIRWLWAESFLAPDSAASLALKRCMDFVDERLKHNSDQPVAQTCTGQHITLKICSSRLECFNRTGAIDINVSETRSVTHVVQNVLLTVRASALSETISQDYAQTLRDLFQHMQHVSSFLMTSMTAAEIHNESAAPGSARDSNTGVTHENVERFALVLLECCSRLFADLITRLIQLDCNLEHVQEGYWEILGQMMGRTGELLEALSKWRSISTTCEPSSWKVRLLDALDALDVVCTAVDLGPEPTRLFRGIHAGAISETHESKITPVLFVVPPCEAITLSCMVFLTRVASATNFARWLPFAHAALCLSLKSISSFLPGEGTLKFRGNLLLFASPCANAPTEHVALQPRDLWLRLCDFFTASNRLMILMSQSIYLSKVKPVSKALLRAMFGETHASVAHLFNGRPLCFPSIILSSALRVGSTTTIAWRVETCESLEADETGNLEARRDCTRRIVEFISMAGHAPHACLDFNKDGPVDLHTCQLIAQALDWFNLSASCIEPTTSMEGEKLTSNSCNWRLHYDPTTVYSRLQSVDKHPQYSRLSNIEPHVLSLTLVVRNALVRSRNLKGITDSLPTDIAHHLDNHLFRVPRGINGSQYHLPRELFHPLLMPRYTLEFLQRPERAFALEVVEKYNPFLLMSQTLMKQLRTPEDPASYPNEVFSSQAYGDLYQAHQNVNDDIRQLTREWAPLRRLKKKSPTEDPSHEVPERAEEEDYVRAATLSDYVGQVPPMPVPPGLENAYAHLALGAASRCTKLESIVQALSHAARDVALCPTRWETWAKVAAAYKHLFFACDDKVVMEEQWEARLDKWRKQVAPPLMWAASQKDLYSQARVLNMMLWARVEKELCILLSAPAAQLQNKPISVCLSRCQELAEVWIQCQLDLLVLLHSRLRTLRQASSHKDFKQADKAPIYDEEYVSKRIFLIHRCDRIARRLLWFLCTCTSYQDCLRDSTQLLRKEESDAAAWPKPKFAKHWDTVSSRLGERAWLMKARNPLPQYVWYIPYSVARYQWRMRPHVKHGLAPVLSDSEILNLLSDACRLESSSHSSHCAGDRVFVDIPNNKSVDAEPYWRLHKTRLQLVDEEPSNWQLAVQHASRLYTPTIEWTRDEARKNCMEALASISRKDQRYDASLAMYEAVRTYRESKFLNSIHVLRKVFMFPSTFPAEGYLGLRFYADEKSELDQCPWSQLAGRKRKILNSRAKALCLCLKIFNQVYHRILPKGYKILQIDEQQLIQQHLSVLKAVPRVLDSWFDSFPASVKSLSLGRTNDWAALHGIVELVIAVLRGVKVEENRFYRAFHWVFLNTLNQYIQSLLCAGPQPRAPPTTQGHVPNVDWTLVAMIRACYLAVKGITQVDAVDIAIANLRKYYLVSIGQMRAHDLRRESVSASKLKMRQANAAGESFSPVITRSFGGNALKLNTSVDGDEVLRFAEQIFQKLREHLPCVEGLWGSSQEDDNAPVAHADGENLSYSQVVQVDD